MFIVLFFSVSAQEETSKKEESFEVELCKDKDAGEWFRLVAGEGDNCRDVIQCTSSGLQAIRCPAGLYFDIEKQTCDWKDAVKNCKLKNKERKVKPLLYTDEPLCQVSTLTILLNFFVLCSALYITPEMAKLFVVKFDFLLIKLFAGYLIYKKKRTNVNLTCELRVS